jgi:hypothetical protein
MVLQAGFNKTDSGLSQYPWGLQMPLLLMVFEDEKKRDEWSCIVQVLGANNTRSLFSFSNAVDEA